MSKKTNTILFILAGTVFNVIVTLVAFLLLLLLYTRFLGPLLPESAAAWALPLVFLAAIVASFFVYRLVMNIVMKKIDMEKYFDPIFGSRRPGPKR